MTLEILKLLVQLLISYAWPIVVVIAIFVFKKPLTELLLSIDKLKTKFFELELIKNIKTVEEAAQKALPERYSELAAQPDDQKRIEMAAKMANEPLTSIAAGAIQKDLDDKDLGVLQKLADSNHGYIYIGAKHLKSNFTIKPEHIFYKQAKRWVDRFPMGIDFLNLQDKGLIRIDTSSSPFRSEEVVAYLTEMGRVLMNKINFEKLAQEKGLRVEYGQVIFKQDEKAARTFADECKDAAFDVVVESNQAGSGDDLTKWNEYWYVRLA